MWIYKKYNGTYYWQVTGTIPTIQLGQWYKVVVWMNGANIRVLWNGQEVVNWTDNSNPIMSGKVGFRGYNYRYVHCLPAVLHIRVEWNACPQKRSEGVV